LPVAEPLTRPLPDGPAEAFSRDTNGTPADWRRWLPGACAQHPLTWTEIDRAEVQVGTGCLLLHWEVLPERRLALARLPRLAVHYRFVDVPPAARQSFMRYFDLYMQRGGG
jgi:hypothetical protein